LGALVRVGWMLHLGKFCGLDESFVGFVPLRKARSIFGPMRVGGFVAPFGELLHGLGMRSCASKGLHRFFGFPGSECPVSAIGIHEQTDPNEALSALGLALNDKVVPEELGKVSCRTDAKAGDGYEHPRHYS
jgi:hypothetical protein